MKIIQLTSENIKRLSAVRIKPDGAVIVIGGRNGQGKTSVLDSIQWGLGGDPGEKMPVRKGEERGRVILDLGDLVVRRVFTASGGTTLTVSNADGVKQTTPQQILDKLLGRLTFDPLEFSRQKPAQQAETLRALIGLDFTELDKRRQQIYDARTATNREAASLKHTFESITIRPVPEQVPDVDQVFKQQREASEHNQKINALGRTAQLHADLAERLKRQSNDLLTQIAELETKVRNLDAEIIKEIELGEAAEKELKTLGAPVDVGAFNLKLKQAEFAKAAIAENTRRERLVETFKAKQAESEKLTEQIDAMDRKRRDAINSAKYPIEGLAFDTAGGVTFNGIPFEQCSSAEQLRVSVAIGIALNPTLKVLLIRDGSLLDTENLKLIAKMAEGSGAQVWIERVGTDASTSVVIEDGAVQAKPEQQDGHQAQ